MIQTLVYLDLIQALILSKIYFQEGQEQMEDYLQKCKSFSQIWQGHQTNPKAVILKMLQHQKMRLEKHLNLTILLRACDQIIFKSY